MLLGLWVGTYLMELCIGKDLAFTVKMYNMPALMQSDITEQTEYLFYRM